uniref:Uncharacterized protein n=1 Tax=viral metagenome TaxID=1070528 RepID=A0A6H1ZE87_9ZZZZ
MIDDIAIAFEKAKPFNLEYAVLRLLELPAAERTRAANAILMPSFPVNGLPSSVYLTDLLATLGMVADSATMMED